MKSVDFAPDWGQMMRLAETPEALYDMFEAYVNWWGGEVDRSKSLQTWRDFDQQDVSAAGNYRLFTGADYNFNQGEHFMILGFRAWDGNGAGGGGVTPGVSLSNLIQPGSYHDYYINGLVQLGETPLKSYIDSSFENYEPGYIPFFKPLVQLGQEKSVVNMTVGAAGAADDFFGIERVGVRLVG